MGTHTLRRRLAGLAATALLGIPALVTAQQLDSIRVIPREVAVTRTFDATLEAVNKSTVAAQTGGAIQAIHADVRDTVEAGTLIVEIDDTVQRAELERARANLAEARAALAEARTRFRRIADLFERQAVSQSEYDQANAAYEAAQARVSAAEAAVAQAEQQLGYTQVRAPYSGVVVQRHAELGETVQPGSPLMTGLSLDQLRATAYIPQRYAGAVRKAAVAEVLAGEGRTIRGQSVTVSPLADDRTHDFEVRVGLPADAVAGLYPGTAVSVRFAVGTREAMLIPESAVMYRSELRAVYVLDGDGRPRLRQVRLGERAGALIEILAGLGAGERIALDPGAAMAAIASGDGRGE